MKLFINYSIGILALGALTSAPLVAFAGDEDTRTVVQICSENYEKEARPCIADVQHEFDESLMCTGVTVTVTSTISDLGNQSGCDYEDACVVVHSGAASPFKPGGSGSDCGGG